MGYAEAIDAVEHIAVLLSKWGPQTGTYRLARELSALAQTELIAAQQDLEQMANVETARGVWLDHIGERLGFPRPYVDDSTGKLSFVGGGDLGFDRGRLYSVNPALATNVPLGDDFYRSMLSARGLALRSGGSQAELEAIAAVLWTGGAVVTKTSAAGEPDAILFTVTETRAGFYTLTTGDAAPLLLGLPLGVTVTFAEA